MNKEDLVRAVAEQAGLSQIQARNAVDAVLDTITKVLARGEEVRLVGFGTFAVSVRAATVGRNPRTGEIIQIASTRVSRFRPAKQLKDYISQAPDTSPDEGPRPSLSGDPYTKP